MIKYYKFPIEKEESKIILPNDFKIEDYAVEIKFKGLENLIVRVGCQTLIINNDLINVLIEELNNNIYDEEYIGLYRKQYDNYTSYLNSDHILSSAEVSNEKEYYITTKNTKLLAKNWSKRSTKSQSSKKYFKYIEQNEKTICVFKDNVIHNIPEILDFLLAIKEFISTPEKYLINEEL